MRTIVLTPSLNEPYHTPYIVLYITLFKGFKLWLLYPDAGVRSGTEFIG